MMVMLLNEFNEYVSNCKDVRAFVEFPKCWLSVIAFIEKEVSGNVLRDRNIYQAQVESLPLIKSLSYYGLLGKPCCVFMRSPVEFGEIGKNNNLLLFGYYIPERCSYIQFNSSDIIQVFFYGVKVFNTDKVWDIGVMKYDMVQNEKLGGVFSTAPDLLNIVIPDLVLQKENN